MAAHGARRLAADGRERVAVIGDRASGGRARLRFPSPRSTSSPPLEAVRAAGARRRCRISATTAISIPTSQRRSAWCARGALVAAARRRLPSNLRRCMMSGARLAQRRARRGAADRQPAPYRAPRLAELAPRFVSPWLARKDADWWIERLYDLPPNWARPSCARRSRARVIDVNRDPSGASLYPGQATTGALPDHDFRRRAALSRRPGARRTRRSRSAARPVFDPYHAALARRDRAAARTPWPGRALRLPFDPLAHSAPVRGRAARSSIRHATAAPAADPALSARDRARHARRRPASPVVNGRFKGGWITRHYGEPDDGRPRPPDGAGLPRLSSTSRRASRPRDNWPPPYDPAFAEPMRRTCAVLAPSNGCELHSHLDPSCMRHP